MSMGHGTGNLDVPSWFKSSYCGSGGGDCVGAAAVPDAVYVRDSKAAGDGPALRVGREEWASFVSLARG